MSGTSSSTTRSPTTFPTRPSSNVTNFIRDRLSGRENGPRQSTQMAEVYAIAVSDADGYCAHMSDPTLAIAAPQLPETSVPYVQPAGTGRAHLLLGQVARA